MNDPPAMTPSCPLPIRDYPNVLLAHGGGGTMMHDLIETIFMPTFENPALNEQGDAAVLQVGAARLAFTTDSYVVYPLFFRGGDIGSLAVHGTVNDLAMSGARPLYLSAGFVLEEGLPMESLWRIVRSMQAAAAAAEVQVVTGDTKVVDKGKGDGIYINTSGVGILEHDQHLGPDRVRPGDVIIVNGDIGRHGIAIMAQREGLQFECDIDSDSACIAGLANGLLDAGIEAHCMRDLTRGGLASALNEVASRAGYSVQIEEREIPVREDVRGACEILGFDPLYVACEGRFVTFVTPQDAPRALELMQADPLGAGASIIGKVLEERPAVVSMTSSIGASRIVDMLSGEQLPRIC